MANNYQESSSFLEIPEDKVNRAQAIIDQVVKQMQEDDEDIADFGIGCQMVIEKSGVWFHGEENCNVESVAAITKELVEQLEIDEPFYCSWSYTCSKPRIDEFGGGAFVVQRGKDTYWIDSMCHVQDKKNQDQKVRELLLTLLDDSYGVCDEGFHRLQQMFRDGNEEIFDAVDGVDGRVWLPQSFEHEPIPSCFKE
jgi:hypothetical protein